MGLIDRKPHHSQLSSGETAQRLVLPVWLRFTSTKCIGETAMAHFQDAEPQGVTETEIEGFSDKFAELGLNATEKTCILPSNFLYAKSQSELFIPPRAADIKVLLRQAGVALDKIEPDGLKIPYRDDRDNTLVLPALLFGAAFLAENAHLLNVSLGVLANYVYDYFRGKPGRNRVVCDVFVETTEKTSTSEKGRVVKKTERKTTKRIAFDGPPDQFDKLVKAIEKAAK